MLELINDLCPLKRDLVSDGFDQALDRLAQEVPMTIHEFRSGERCWTWQVPEKWTCEEAYLETIDGKTRPIEYKNHPLHVVSYSLGYDGVIPTAELLQHIHVHPRLPDAIPFVFKYYDRDWGLCCSQTVRDGLTDPEYRVVIRPRFEPGTLKMGEIVVPGATDECFVVVTHLCHPAQFNDDLSGVAVAVEAARALLAGPQPHYTYRFLILPETIGSVAYLSRHEGLIPKMKGGLFLEMLGNDSPHALQGSFQPTSQPDKCFTAALKTLDPHGYCAPYRTVINNDERQFNGPGVRVPMLSLSRVEPPGSPTRPYREYHSSLDTPAITTEERLQDSLRVALGLIEAWEQNQYVVNHFKGEIFCSGYGIWIDYRVNPEGHRRLFEIMERCDGGRTIADIAAELDIPFAAVREVTDLLASRELVSYRREIG
jgi:aminopeptidase-like protein